MACLRFSAASPPEFATSINGEDGLARELLLELELLLLLLPELELPLLLLPELELLLLLLPELDLSWLPRTPALRK